MSYSLGQRYEYATAGLGALGFDRLVEGRSNSFVFSITAVLGLPSGTASLVPTRIVEYMRSNGISAPEAGWAAGGRVWGRFTLPVADPLILDPAKRRTTLRHALEQAARSLGSGVSFDVEGLGRIPTSVPAGSASSGGIVQLPPTDIVGSVPTSTVSVIDVQNMVRSKGFNPGTLDGKWGSNTAGALKDAARAAGMPLSDGEAVGSSDKRSVTLPTAVWAAIPSLPNRAPPASPATTAVAPTVDDVNPPPGGIQLMDWLPWTLGGAALLGIGGFFIYRGRKKVRANRRRSRRHSRRRSRRSRR